MAGTNVLSRFRQEGGRLWVKTDEGNLRWNSRERLEGSGWIQNNDNWVPEEVTAFFVSYLKKPSNNRVKNEVKGFRRKLSMNNLRLSRHWLEGNEENNDKFQSGQSVSWLEFKSGTLRTWVVVLSLCKTTQPSMTFINLCICICVYEKFKFTSPFNTSYYPANLTLIYPCLSEIHLFLK